MDTVLMLLQALGVISLGVISFLPNTRNADGVFTRLGWSLWIFGAFLFITSTLIKEHQTKEDQDHLQYQIEEIRDRLFKQTLSVVMETPKGPKITLTQVVSDKVQINAPSDGAEALARYDVYGQVTKGYKDLWVIIHPTDTSSYWVQPSVSVNRQGRWSVNAYFGRSGDIDIGKTFEIMAVLNPKKKLREGLYFDKWPIAEFRSDIVSVVRQ